MAPQALVGSAAAQGPQPVASEVGLVSEASRLIEGVSGSPPLARTRH